MLERPSTGDRVVYCTRVDCAFRDELIPSTMIELPTFAGRHWYVCVADILVMDRRARVGKTCGRYAKRGPGK